MSGYQTLVRLKCCASILKLNMDQIEPNTLNKREPGNFISVLVVQKHRRLNHGAWKSGRGQSVREIRADKTQT